MKTLEQLIADIIELEKENQERFAKRQAKLESMWSEANDHIAPTIDIHGRLHAPYSGYQLPTHIDFSTTLQYGDEFFFEKGQYLPIPLSESNYHKTMNSRLVYSKVKSVKSEIEEFINRIQDNLYINSKFNTGKSWEQYGVEVCYLYTTVSDKTSEAICNMIQEYFSNILESYKVVPVYTGVMTEGKRTVSGTVKKISYSSYDTGYSIVSSEKMTVVLDDDTTCYGSVPKSVYLSVGDRIEFTAIFSKSDKIHHGWFKRPSKLTKLEEV